MRPHKNTLDQTLSVKFSGMIWKIKVHPSGVIAIETRNVELKQVLFSAFNYVTGETYFKEHAFDEDWNLSLVFAGPTNIILSAFEHAATPESKGILSVNAEDGKVIWQKFNISFSHATDQGLQVYDTRLQPRKYYWIDHLTGEPMISPITLSPNTDIFFPETDLSFTIPSFIEHGAITGEISTLHYSDKVLTSFHEVENDYLKQRLVVYQEDRVLIDDILISGIQKLQPEAFFIQQNHLFYVRNKEELISYLV